MNTTTLKAKIAAIGATLTAVTSALAAVQVTLDDGRLDAGEYGAIATAVVVMIGTVYGVWRAPNKPKDDNNAV